MKKIIINAQDIEATVPQTNYTKIIEALEANPDGLMSHEIYDITKADSRRIREILQRLKADGKVKDDKVCRCGRTPIYIYK